MSDLFLLQDVAKSYTKGKESIPIFDHLNLNIPEGDFVAIMGPSGSGKTTLLNLLGGIDQVSSGSLLFRDQHLENYSESQLSKWRAKNVGFIFQFYNLMPMLNAAQNVELPLMLTNLNGAERAKNVRTALEVVGLSDRARHSPKEMSGGQQQRVAIARAIVADPSVLICDEPTGDLDRTTANEILEMLQLLNRELKKTVIMVTHDAAAARYAQRTLHLDKGKFIEETMTHA
jgi:putative ABC transport system ATP-binding protein